MYRLTLSPVQDESYNELQALIKCTNKETCDKVQEHDQMLVTPNNLEKLDMEAYEPDKFRRILMCTVCGKLSLTR